MTILTLSVELLQEIALLLPSYQKHLRAVCRDLNFAIAPLVFSSVVLGTQKLGIETTLFYLKGLATGQTGWSQFARTLKIYCLSHWAASGGSGDKTASPQVQSAYTHMEIFLRPALESLKGIQTVVWQVNKSDPDWLDHDIIDALSSLSGLRKLSISATDATDDTVFLGKFIRPMAQIVAKSPNLSSLRLIGHDYAYPSATNRTLA
ncbi:hypothetical protein B0H10DRAFT_67973 [Mycena sp. CBHHK59/15]|nr:hypothetical protein B0H10DRAFT_67973 [Mycena sp. CBHHK59/15]